MLAFEHKECPRFKGSKTRITSREGNCKPIQLVLPSECATAATYLDKAADLD